MSQPIIEVNGISKRYHLGQYGFSSFREETEKWWRRLRGQPVEAESARDFWALRDVSFAVQPGEVVGLIGRNGAGKSTLLKILSRITEPTAGEVVLRGRVASLLEVGTGFHPELSGRENIFLNGAILGMTKAEIARKFDEIVAFAEIEQFIDTPVKRYSSGMYVRLAFAVAAHLEPEILIVDEVLAVGDARFQRKCLAKMEDAASRMGRTVLFVSHSMDAVARLCHRAIVMHGGTVVGDGPVVQGIDRYHALSGGSEHVGLGQWLSLEAYAAGAGAARFRRMRMENLSRPGATTLCAGEGLKVVLEIEAQHRLSVRNLAVMISNRNGVRLVNADTGKLGREVVLQPGVQRVAITIDQLPLTSGEFNLSLWLANTHGSQIYHSIPERLSLLISEPPHGGIHDKPETDGLLHVPFSLHAED